MVISVCLWTLTAKPNVPCISSSSHDLSEWFSQPGTCCDDILCLLSGWRRDLMVYSDSRRPPFLFSVGPSVILFYLALGRTGKEKDTTPIWYICLINFVKKIGHHNCGATFHISNEGSCFFFFFFLFSTPDCTFLNLGSC